MSLLTVDETGTTLTASAVTGPDTDVPAVAVDTVELTSRLPAWSPPQLAARTGRPVVVRDPVTEARFARWTQAAIAKGVAHELRTPLTTVRGVIETLLLREEQLSVDDRRHMLEISRRNAVDLTHRIASLLEHAKLEGDHVTVDPTVQLLGPVLRDSLDNCRGLLSEHPLVVEVPDGLLADVDEIALDHIVANLVSNGVKYAPPGSPLTIRAEVVEDDTVVVSVEDHGIGIPAADLPFVFDRFYRGGGQGRRSGTGIGLAIVKRYVELSGGRISVESTVGEGTAFRFSLPCVGIEPADPGADPRGGDAGVLAIRPDPAPVD